MFSEDKMRWIGQTAYEKYQKRGFPKGCLEQVVLFGIHIEQLPKDFSIQESKLYECRINGMSLNHLDLSGCVITDCIFDSLQIEYLKITGTSIHETVFFGNQIGRLDFSDANLNHSIIQDSKIDFLHMDRAVLNGTHFYRILHQTVTGHETVKMIFKGAVRDKAEAYSKSVNDAIFS